MENERSKNMQLIKKIRYYFKFFKLAIHAGLVWGVKDVHTIAGWKEMVRNTPLKYELEKLEAERRTLGISE